MSEVINQKKAELADAIKTEIQTTLSNLIQNNFDKLMLDFNKYLREDQINVVFGKELYSYITEYLRNV